MTLRRSWTFNDTERRAASLRQLSFLWNDDSRRGGFVFGRLCFCVCNLVTLLFLFNGLFGVDSVVADGTSSQNFRHWSAETSSDRLLGSAKPGHTEPSDWSAAKKIDDGYQSKGWSCWILSIVLVFTVFRMKVEQNSCIIVKFNAIFGVLTIYAN